MESAFSFRLWRSLLLNVLHASTVTGNEIVCDGVCFQLHVSAETDFSKTSGLIVNGSERFCDGVSEDVCLQLQAVIGSAFSQVSDLYYEVAASNQV